MNRVVQGALLLALAAAGPLDAQSRGTAGRATGTARSAGTGGTGTIGSALGSASRAPSVSIGSALYGYGSAGRSALPGHWRVGTATGWVAGGGYRYAGDALLHAGIRGRHAGIGILVTSQYPVVYHHTVTGHHVQTYTALPAPYVAAPGVVPPGAAVGTGAAGAVEACAIVTVLQPGHRGYWQQVRLPLAGARNRDELQRVLDARLAEGEAFRLRDADEELLDIPADTERLIVLACDR